jgi:carbonic anhydrase/acetyltransferase-like protein (isoleucine patch superfamily)
MIKRFQGKGPRIASSAWVSQQAVLIGEIEVGEGSSIWPGAVIRADSGPVIIGRNCHIEENCVIHGPTRMGDYVCLGPGAVAEAVRIGSYVLIGSNATILREAQLADYCIITANSLVKEKMEVPTRSLVAGVPGEIRRFLQSQDIKEELEGMTKTLAPLAQQFKKEGF